MVLAAAGCSRGAPEPTVTNFATRQALDTWIGQQCGYGPLREAFVHDRSRSPRTYASAFYVCTSIGAIEDVTIEVRGSGLDICGVRIGPAKLDRRVDANLVLPWFRDQALGERVATALATEKATIVDGLFVGMLQDMKGTTKFMLVIDGCGKYPVEESEGAMDVF